MSGVRALLLLGSSSGDRSAALRRAVRALAALPGCRLLAASRVYETAPVGPARGAYLNQAVLLRAARTPMGLLLEAKVLEAAAGRRPARRWSSRPLDVDLVWMEGRAARGPWLTLPHPRAAGRAFALAPLADVAGDVRLGGRPIRERLASMNPPAGIVKVWREHGRR